MTDAASSPDPDCLFCTIVAGDVPGDRVHETQRSLAFRDVDPQAPTHVLVVPKDHHRDVGALAAADPEALADLVAVAELVARQDGLDGWRVVFNTGPAAGQSVFHCHAHVLGGRPLTWPPG
ncbi:MAG: histidine triad nucleotide-binding protein [Actinomycetota bacterium]|nr:histidine triad nucleotide-binding protein [Actinomycetota bacterium]